MSERIQAVLDSQEKSDLRQFFSQLRQQEKRYLLRNDILHEFSEYCKNHQKPESFINFSHLGKPIYYTEEIIREDGNLYLVIRPKVASQEVYRLTEDLIIDRIAVQELLDLRDRFVNHFHPNEGN